jgi:hypothetical protein
LLPATTSFITRAAYRKHFASRRPKRGSYRQGKYSIAYYDSSDNLSEEALKNALHDITGNGYDSLGYNIARDSMFMVIDNQKVNGQGAAQNTVECIYTAGRRWLYQPHRLPDQLFI